MTVSKNTPTPKNPDLSVVIVDTGCANTSSVQFAIERLGYTATITADADTILSADRVFLPGVGTAEQAMENLHARGLVTVIQHIKNPVLGICLGMQMLCERSVENGTDTACLGMCSAPVETLDTGNYPSPHMGWNTTTATAENHPLLNGIGADDYFYFVHSYAVPVGDYTVARCDYGSAFSAIIQVGNYYGVQFHPERSAQAGAKLIQNFLEAL